MPRFSRLRARLLPLLLAAAWRLTAAAGLDGTKVPAYGVPEVLQFEGGTGVCSNAPDWRSRRRPELMSLFSREVYGRPVPPPTSPRWRVLVEDTRALGGRATRRVAALQLGEDEASRVLRFTVFLPNGMHGPRPVFAGVHLFDTAKPHPEIAVARKIKGETPNAPATPEAPGRIGRETTDRILARGYAVASLDIDWLGSDSPADWWKGLLRQQGRAREGPPGPEETGVLGVWAWGLSRVIDYCATTPDLDSRRVVALGHSRMGKAALWAGAVDERFAAVISNNSGCGGAALSKRIFGETVAIITRAFPHWFCGNFARYADHEADLPVDQHELLALIAPRPLYIASAEEDRWADPLGEYLAAWHASPVYRLLGATALDGLSTNLPPVDAPVGGALHYHVRRGQHDLTDYDWLQYLEFADRYVARR